MHDMKRCSKSSHIHNVKLWLLIVVSLIHAELHYGLNIKKHQSIWMNLIKWLLQSAVLKSSAVKLSVRACVRVSESGSVWKLDIVVIAMEFTLENRTAVCVHQDDHDVLEQYSHTSHTFSLSLVCWITSFSLTHARVGPHWEALLLVVAI